MNQDADIRIAAATEEYADVGSERLARVYAESLLAAAGPQTAEVLQELDSLIGDVFAANPQVEALFAGAAVGRNARRAALEKVFAGRASDVFFRFLMVLNEHERLNLLRPIRLAAHEIDNERHRRIKVHIFTAVPLSADYGARIAEAVRRRFSMEPIIVSHVDASLLGGLKVRIGDQQIDATVRNRLDTLRNQVIARSSHEIQSRRDQFSTD
jgi:ATP synthase F1 delta subunit